MKTKPRAAKKNAVKALSESALSDEKQNVISSDDNSSDFSEADVSSGESEKDSSDGQSSKSVGRRSNRLANSNLSAIKRNLRPKAAKPIISYSDYDDDDPVDDEINEDEFTITTKKGTQKISANSSSAKKRGRPAKIIDNTAKIPKLLSRNDKSNLATEVNKSSEYKDGNESDASLQSVSDIETFNENRSHKTELKEDFVPVETSITESSTNMKFNSNDLPSHSLLTNLPNQSLEQLNHDAKS